MKKLSMLIALCCLTAVTLAQLIGPGLNMHDVPDLPADQIKAVFGWLRADSAPGKISPAAVKAFRAHYGLPVLWMIPTAEPNFFKAARQVYGAGIRDIEVCNEPDLNEPGLPHLEPEAAADQFVAVWEAVPSTVRLYGPSTSRWNPEYIDRFVARLKTRLGDQWRQSIAAISIHLYWSKVEDMPSLVYECQKRWGLPLICTEVSSSLGTWADYPEKRPAPDLFSAIRSTMGEIPWVWYDGPEDPRYPSNRAMFRRTDAGWVPTPLYQQIRTDDCEGPMRTSGPRRVMRRRVSPTPPLHRPRRSASSGTL